MDERIKYRLTGAVVAVSLAIIFLPMLFDGAGVPDIPFEVDMPAPPVSAVDPLPGRSEEAWAFVDEVEQLRERFDRSPALIGQPEHRAIGLDEASSGADPQGVPLAWSVQLASFLREDNAASDVARTNVLRERKLEQWTPGDFGWKMEMSHGRSSREFALSLARKSNWAVRDPTTACASANSSPYAWSFSWSGLPRSPSSAFMRRI